MIENPHMLTKVRSDDLRASIGGSFGDPFPCSVRLSPLMGRPCSHITTVVGAHMPTIGNGMGTKVSDLFMVAACDNCHKIIDGVGGAELAFKQRYPAAYFDALMRGHHETLSRWVGMRLITGTDWKLI